jgi:hypothetical protein
MQDVETLPEIQAPTKAVLASRSARTSVRLTPVEFAKLKATAVMEKMDVTSLVRQRLIDIIGATSFICTVCKTKREDSDMFHHAGANAILVCRSCGESLPSIIFASQVPDKWISVMYQAVDFSGHRMNYDRGVAFLTEDLNPNPDPRIGSLGISWHRSLETATEEAYRMARRGIKILEAFHDGKPLKIKVDVKISYETVQPLPVSGSLFDP